MSESANHGRIRAGDADRDRVVEQLRDHHEAGRLDAEEFTQRMEGALLARYLDELPPLLGDLPPASRQPSGGFDAPPRGRRSGGPGGAPSTPPLIPLIPVLSLLAVAGIAGSIALLVHGHFPFPLIWVGLGFLWLVKWRGWQQRHARWAHAHQDHDYGHGRRSHD